MPTTSGRKLPLLSKLGFGIGQGAEGLHTIGVNAFLVLYYQQVLGLPGSRAGLALLLRWSSTRSAIRSPA